jgi:hypothetical protein
MLYLRKESQGFIKSNNKARGWGDGIGGSNHGLFTFLMVHCLGYSIQKDME